MGQTKDYIILLAGRINYKADRFLMQELRNRGQKGLAPSHGEILGALLMKGKLQMKDLVTVLEKDKSTITALVNKLVKLGYVKKSSDPDDKRVSYISLTQKGKSFRPDFMEISKKLRKQAYRNITDDEKDTLFKLLNKINENF